MFYKEIKHINISAKDDPVLINKINDVAREHCRPARQIVRMLLNSVIDEGRTSDLLQVSARPLVG